MPAGTLIVWLTQLSPAGSDPETAPISAALVPLCTCAVLTDGAMAPPMVQYCDPDSNPPLTTADGLANGVTGFDGADCGPVPFGLDAVTVNV